MMETDVIEDSGLSMSERLLVAQAVYNVKPIGTVDESVDWVKVAEILRDHLRRIDKESSSKIDLDPVVCRKVYQNLCEIYQDQGASDDIEPALRIVKMIYQDRIKRILQSLKEEERRYKNLCIEIEPVDRGESDDKLELPVMNRDQEEEEEEEVDQKLSGKVHSENPSYKKSKIPGSTEAEGDQTSPFDPKKLNLSYSGNDDNGSKAEEAVSMDEKFQLASPQIRTRKRKLRSGSVSAPNTEPRLTLEPVKQPSSTSSLGSDPFKKLKEDDQRFVSPKLVSGDVSMACSSPDSEDQVVLEQLTSDRAQNSSIKVSEPVKPDEKTLCLESVSKLQKTPLIDENELSKTTEPTVIDPEDASPTQDLKNDLKKKNPSRRSPSINSKKISQKNKKSVDKTKKEEKEDTQNPVRSPTVDCKKTFQRIKAEEKTTKEDSPNLVQSPEVSKKAHLELELGAEDACAETPTSACFPTGVTEESSNAQKTPVSAEMVVPPTDQIAAPRSAASTQSDSTSFRRRMIKTHSSVQSNPVSAVFRKPVKDSDAPGYSVIVKRPMDLRTLARKLRDGEVTSAEEYRRDLMLMLANAVMFNHEDSQVSKNAKELMIDCDRLVSIFMRGSRY